jgi:multidrug efflux pump subunit AcrA (membrane-fusion protein)
MSHSKPLTVWPGHPRQALPHHLNGQLQPQPQFLPTQHPWPADALPSSQLQMAVVGRRYAITGEGYSTVGQVNHVAGEADLQRNTLQVKVTLDSPDPRLRPEMLCRAEFLRAVVESAATGESNGARVSIFVSVRAFVDRQGADARVWVISDDRVESREVTLEGEERDGYRLVTDGLLPGDRVVLDPAPDLATGDRVEPVIESGNSTEGTP